MNTKVKPEQIIINKIFYYNSKDLFDYDPVFYYGCKSKPRSIIERKKIPITEYIFANLNLKLKEWKLSNIDCKKAQLLISKLWVDKYFFKIDDIIISDTSDIVINEPVNIINEPVNIIVEPVNIIDEPVNIQENEEIVEAPEIIDLDDNEKFKDTDGNIIEIETRGTKNRKNIYFKVADVINTFNMPNLDCTLRNKFSEYKKNIHYKLFFIRVKQYEILSNTIKKEQYLTYKGILRVLFNSNSGNAEMFQDWAEDCLFTIQMGTPEDKIKLGTNILNITPKTYKAVFSTYSSKFPCIYLLSLGTVGLLRNTFGINSTINDDLIVYKYGFTDDLSRRIGEHESKYGKLPNVKIHLATFHIIDPIYTCNAESDIRYECNAYEVNLKVNGYNELIILNEKQFMHIKKNYERIGKEYTGHTAELQKEIERLKSNEKSRKLELENKDLIIENKKLKIENLELQIKMLTNNKN